MEAFLTMNPGTVLRFIYKIKKMRYTIRALQKLRIAQLLSFAHFIIDNYAMNNCKKIVDKPSFLQ